MPAKNIRNAIIALIIMAIGVWFLLRLGKAFMPKDSPVDFTSIITSVESLMNIFLIGVIIIIIILIPVWIAKRKEEKPVESY